jgi:glutaconate CoA-transferase, subunit B
LQEHDRLFSGREAVVISASKMMRNGDVVIVGQGLPVLAALFAKRNHAPNCVIMQEYGVVDMDPPYAVELAHPLLAETASYLCDMMEALTTLLYRVDCAFLGAAQVDRYGNVNTTTIGDYFNPKVRISGSGGANDIGSMASKFVVLMDKQSKSKFPERVDYNTTPGYFNGSRAKRERLGLPGKGPVAVFTDLGVYKFLPKTGEMYLSSLAPGVMMEQVMKNTGWKIKTASRIAREPPPTRREANLLRSLDPRGVYLH